MHWIHVRRSRTAGGRSTCDVATAGRFDPSDRRAAVLTASSVDDMLHDARKFMGFLKSDVLQRYAERVE